MCHENVRTGERGVCRTYEEILLFFSKTSGSLYIGHNIVKFDAPVLNRVVGTQLLLSSLVDTLILATLYSPSIDGGHSLGVWGERIGVKKTDFSDYSRLTPEMIDYCHQDVSVTAELFKRLTKVLNRIGFSEKSCQIQHHITSILERQRRNGFSFNREGAILLYQRLRKSESDIESRVREVFPPERVMVGERQRCRKDGTATAIFERDQTRFIIGPGSTTNQYRAYEDIEFNLGSPNQRVTKLLELGWDPEEFTPKTKKGGGGNPMPFDKGDLSPSLQNFLEDKEIPEVEMIARWMSVNGRANMVNTWLDNYDEDTGCIHGKLFVADTLRFRHQAPNTANIPAVRVDKAGTPLLGELGYFTYEARNLWVARKGRVLVGTDAAGLELRMLAHYLDREGFTEGVVNGDPHQYNADIVGIQRPQAKTLIYATLYGAGGPKIARTLGVSVKEGSRIRILFLERLGLSELIAEAKKEQERGRVSLVDGSLVVCPSPHAALNYKLQGGGARVMAQAAIFLDGHIRKAGLDSLKVGDIHDEWQYDVLPSDADEHALLSVQSIVEAGKELGLRVPLDGTPKKGLTWAETH
jgi:DNA polymerase-1